MKIKLIRPPAFDDTPGGIPPLGIATLTAFLRGKKLIVDQDDLLEKVRVENRENILFPKINLEQFRDTKKVSSHLFNNKKTKKFDIALEKILDLTCFKNFDIVGFSIHSPAEFLFSCLLTKKLKEIYSNVYVVFGGPYLTAHIDLFLKKLFFVDFIILGDGEIPFYRLCCSFKKEKPKFEKIPCLVYKKDGCFIKSDIKLKITCSSIIPDFNGLPLEAYHILKDGKWQIMLPYQISKGCNNRCTFCTHNFQKERYVKPIKKVTSDIKYLSDKYNTSLFVFNDSDLNISHEYLENLTESFIKHKLNIEWISLFISPKNLDKNLLSKLKRSGCFMLKFGIESGSKEILKTMNKNIALKEASKILKDSYNAGIKNDVLLIYGFIYENMNDVEETQKFIIKNSKYINSIIYSKFRLSYNSQILNNFSFFKIKNVTPLYEDMFSLIEYKFDETNGLNWSVKQKFQKKAFSLLLKTEYKYMIKNEKRKKVMPYFLYFLFQTKDFYRNKFLKIVYKFYTNFYKKKYYPEICWLK